MMIFNPGAREGRLPTEAECRAEFEARGLEVAAYEAPLPGIAFLAGGGYPRVLVLTTDGDLYGCDMLHGGGTFFELY